MLRSYLCKAGIAAVTLAVLPAQAADVVSETATAAPPPAITAPDWSGPYLGVHAGYGWADVTQIDTFGPLDPTVNYDADGGLLGGQIGYNWQFGQAVFGIEGDLAWSNVSGSTAGPPFATSFDINAIGSIRGRAGWTFDSFLLFGTIGAGLADIDVVTPFDSDSEWHTGLVLGAGGEWRANNNMSVGAEYLYGDFGQETYTIGGAPDLVEFKTHTIRATLNWHFGFWQ